MIKAIIVSIARKAAIHRNDLSCNVASGGQTEECHKAGHLVCFPDTAQWGPFDNCLLVGFVLEHLLGQRSVDIPETKKDKCKVLATSAIRSSRDLIVTTSSPRCDTIHSDSIGTPLTCPIPGYVINGSFCGRIGCPSLDACDSSNGSNIDHRRRSHGGSIRGGGSSLEEFMTANGQPKHATKVGIQDELQLFLWVFNGWFTNICTNVIDQYVQSGVTPQKGLNILYKITSSHCGWDIGNHSLYLHPTSTTEGHKLLQLHGIPSAGQYSTVSQCQFLYNGSSYSSGSPRHDCRCCRWERPIRDKMIWSVVRGIGEYSCSWRTEP